MMMSRYGREIAAGAALGVVLVVLAVAAPSFFQPANLRDLLLNNAGAMIAALGITAVIAAGHIDISIGSQFAVCSVLAGLAAKAGVPMFLVPVIVLAAGFAMGALNGVMVTALRVPSIVVTLASMIVIRDLLRWSTEGAWIQGLPAGFQWLGMSQAAGTAVILGVTAGLVIAFAWCLRNLSAGRQLFAAGSNPGAAVLAGFRTDRIFTGVFAVMGLAAAAAALLNAIRFSEVPGNPGAGLELKAIAAAVVGGASITGGRATITGTVLGVLLLGVIGTALTYLGINPYWEKAAQGVIIIAAAASEFAGRSAKAKVAYGVQ